MGAITTAKRAIAKTHSERMVKIRADDKLDEYIKHRPHYLAFGRWINEGKPDSGLVVDWPMNNRQRRQSTRKVRSEDHVRRCVIANHNITGKSAFRKRQRAV